MDKLDSMNVQQLRSVCRQVGVDPGWRKKEQKLWLNREEMTQVIKRTELKKRGEEKWLRPGTTPPLASRAAHAFWVDSAAMQPNASASTSALPGYGQLGIASACQSGLRVVLWTYGKLTGVPMGFGHLEVKDASALLPKDQALAYLQRGMRIQHLADYIRFLAIKAHHAEKRYVRTYEW